MFGVFKIKQKTAIICLVVVIVICGVSLLLLRNHVHIGKKSGNNAVEFTSTLIYSCKEKTPKTESVKCLRGVVQQVLDRYKLADAIVALEASARQKYPESVVPKCHDEAHVLGELAGERTHDLGQVMLQCGRACGYGCIHGAVLGALRKDPTILDRLASICLPFISSNVSGQDYTACNHGLGHGFVEITERDSVKPFLLCDRLNADGAREQCATGGFMELFEPPFSLNEVTIALPKGFKVFCKSLPTNYQKMCFTRAGIYEYKKTEDVLKAQNVCEHLDIGLISECFTVLGSDLHFIFLGDVKKVWDACQTSNENKTISCLYGALDSSLVTDNSGELGIQLCQLATGRVNLLCLERLKERVERIHGSQ